MRGECGGECERKIREEMDMEWIEIESKQTRCRRDEIKRRARQNMKGMGITVSMIVVVVVAAKEGDKEKSDSPTFLSSARLPFF